jgi:PAS domain S-box-containing protein
VNEGRVLVLAPTGKDAAMTVSVLAHAGIEASACAGVDELLAGIGPDAASVLVAEEALAEGGLDRLAARLAGQPPWSDLPVILLSGPGAHSEAIRFAMEKLGNVTVLERPMRVAAAVSTVRTALRARSRQYQVRAALEERERAAVTHGLLAAIVASSDDAIVSKTLDGTILTWNAGAERVFGYTAEEAIGQPITMLIPPERQAEEPGVLERMRRGERIDHFETVRSTKDGRRIDISLTISPIFDASGKVIGASKVARDITARKRAERELRRSEEELRTLADSIPQLAWIASGDGYTTWYNRGWYEYTGSSFEEMAGEGWRAAHDPAVLPQVVERWKACLRTGDQFEMEYPLRGADGTFRWFLARARPVRDEDGRIIRWFGTCTDLHEAKRTSEALAEESRLLNLLNETARSIAGDLDLETLVQKVTDAATQLSGAEFGAFFYNRRNEKGESFLLFTLSGAERAAFERFGQPRATPLFAPTFRGEGPIRCDDVQSDARYGQWGGMPAGHLPVRSYMAAPVVSRSGEVIGGLFFGHSRAGVFSERVERVITGLAAQAAVGIDNARLYERVKRASEERRQLLEAERRARSEAERLNNMKDEFLATLSHELRTPLHAIVGWSQVLRSRSHADTDVVEGLSVIDRNAKMQAQLIEDLLDTSRIVSGKVRLDVERVNLQDIAHAAIASVRKLAESKGLHLQAAIDQLAGPVRGDPVRLQQCCWNLLSNAIKFTPRGGHVQVSLAQVESHLEFKVADDGQGIAPDFLPHVFERFRQADSSTTRRHGGLGLGLSIVAGLVEMHGGAVRASSPGVGLGATFCIALPLMALQPPASVGEPAWLRVRVPDALIPAPPSLARITALVVDDEPDARGLVKRLLEDCGARVLVADSARTGLETLRRERPDILISDIGMPGEDGYSFIGHVRKLAPEGGGRIAAVALSALARPEDRTRALRAGYQIHLSKPADPSELTAAVASLTLRPTSERPREPELVPGTRRIRVLHVDDNPDARVLLSFLFKHEKDIEEVGSRSNAEGLEKVVRETAPDVLLMDLTMQGKDPIEAIREVRAAFPELRIVALTGTKDPRLLERARQAGASELASKVVDVSETLNVIRRSSR